MNTTTQAIHKHIQADSWNATRLCAVMCTYIRVHMCTLFQTYRCLHTTHHAAMEHCLPLGTDAIFLCVMPHMYCGIFPFIACHISLLMWTDVVPSSSALQWQ